MLLCVTFSSLFLNFQCTSNVYLSSIGLLLGDIGGSTLCLSEPGLFSDPWEGGLWFGTGLDSTPGCIISLRGWIVLVGSPDPISKVACGDLVVSLCISLAEVRPDRLELALVRSELVSDEPGTGTLLTGAEKDLWFSVRLSGIIEPSPIWPSTLCGAVFG